MLSGVIDDSLTEQPVRAGCSTVIAPYDTWPQNVRRALFLGGPSISFNSSTVRFRDDAPRIFECSLILSWDGSRFDSPGNSVS